jgi:beta-lactamase regulating signal transducer with metallopeptidase domain
MTSLGIAIITAAIQVTLLALPAVALIAWAARRSPRAGANLAAAALVACAMLSVIAVVPLPHWWTWDAPPSVEASPLTAETDLVTSSSNSDGGRWHMPLSRLTALLSATGPSPTATESPWNAWTIVGGVFLTGLTVECLRLLSGLWAIAVIRRQTTSITVPDLIAQVDEMSREFGVNEKVTVRQSAMIGTAATVGWWRPAILLAADWPTWDQAERRAVLAHELAHVRRRDYLTSLLAAMCRAAHYYHPLVRWLAARLRLHQELAADALAASAAGGRAVYLQALARMALRQDAAVVAGMARPFLSDRGSLIRRIAMLRITDDSRLLGRATRWSLMAVLGLAAFGASAVRGPAQATTGEATVKVEDVPPFEISQVPANSNMLFAFRPAAILAKPGMNPLADRFNRAIAAESKAVGFPANMAVTIQEIEQVVVSGEARKASPPPGRDWKPDEPQQGIYEDTILIRMTHDFDWPAVIRAGAAAFKAEMTKGRPGLYRVVTGGCAFYFQIMDRRTMCCITKDQFPPKDGGEDAALARAKPAADPAAAWGPAWAKAQRAASVVALDNRKEFWTTVSGPTKPPAELLASIGRPRHVVACLDLADTVAAHLYMTADDSAPNQQRAKMDALAVAMLAGLRDVPTATVTQRTAIRIMREMLNGRSVRRDGTTDIAEFRSPAKLADLFLNVDLPGAVEEH